MKITMRSRCNGLGCGSTEGEVRPRGDQQCVYCATCGKYAGYNAPKAELGLARRSISTTHAAIKPKDRVRIIERSNGRCELCGRGDGIHHVGHMISVADGHADGLSDAEINSDENIAAMCEECNLGLGAQSVRLRTFARILFRRLRDEKDAAE